MSQFWGQIWSRKLFFFSKIGKNRKYWVKNFHNSSVGKAGTLAKNEFGIFETQQFWENSEKLEPQIRNNWSRPHLPYTINHIPYAIHHIPFTIYHKPYTIYHMPYTICHIPYAIYHMSYAICHMPYAICHISSRQNFSKNARSDLRFLILTLSSILDWTFNEWSVPCRKK